MHLATGIYNYSHETGIYTATTSAYTNFIPDPQFLPVSVSYYFPEPNLLKYIITIGPANKNYIYILDIVLLNSSGVSTGVITSSPINFDIQTPYGMIGNGFSKATDAVILNCTYNIIKLYDAPFDNYVNGDTYEITMQDLLEGSIGLKGLRVVASRKNQTTIMTNANVINVTNNITNNVTNINNLSNVVRIPSIDITAQTTLNNLDVGEAIFVIGDDRKYSKHQCHSSCGDYFIQKSKIKITTFNVYTPFMVSVVRGKGKNLYDKVFYLFTKYHPGPSFPAFYDDIITYGMVKYILSKILYGNFDMNYLLRQYNSKFLKDLSHSRFCHFIEFFNNNHYNQYFKK